MYDQIYSDYHDKVLHYIYAKVNDMPLAEDLCSDVFLKVLENMESFDSQKASLSTWIFSITRNRLTDYYRTRRVYEEIPETYSDDSDMESDLCTRETLEQLADALLLLEQRERDIIILHYYSNVTLTEIARQMHISYAYVKVLHNKALSALKRKIL